MKKLFALAILFAGCSAPQPRPDAAEQVQAVAEQAVAAVEAATMPETAPAVMDGPMETTYPSGKLRTQGNMRHGQRHGIWTSFFENGAVQSRSDYVDGIKQGPTVTFFANGTPRYTGAWYKDKEVGEWKYFDTYGTLVKTVRFDSLGAVINDR